MGYKLQYSRSIITRPANIVAYNAFSLFSGADSVEPSVALRTERRKLSYLVSMSIMLNWALVPASSSIRVYLLTENPGVVVDQSSNTSFNLSSIPEAYLNKFFFNTVNDGAGNQYGYINLVPSIQVTSSVQALFAIVEIASGITNTVSGGQLKFTAAFEEPIA